MSIEECKKIIRGRLASKLNISVGWEGRCDEQNLADHFEADRNTDNTFPFDKTKDAILRGENLTEEESEELLKQTQKIDGIVNEAVKRIGNRYCPSARTEKAASIPEAVFDRAVAEIERERPGDLVIVAPDLWIPSDN